MLGSKKIYDFFTASFAPEIRTTGQTIKVYAESGRLFEGKYYISLS